MGHDRTSLLKKLPSVDRFLEHSSMKRFFAAYPRGVVIDAIRGALDAARRAILSGEEGEIVPGGDAGRVESYETAVEARIGATVRPSLRRVINATGVVIHTNLGRSPIAPEAFDRARDIATAYSNLEYDLEKGERGSRHDHVERLLVRLTGAEAAVVTNNCAAALMTALHAFARGREVIVSRGELIEIGGSFRLPEIMEASGSRLVEVGTTNRTHPEDYRRAITSDTAALLKVHLSNFRQEGFTTQVSAPELAAIAAEAHLPLLHDVGSGSLLEGGGRGDRSVQQEVAAGADLVMMSGDKLLGSVQAGIVVGRKEAVKRFARLPFCAPFARER